VKEPNNAPVYASLYTTLASIVREHGYCAAVHGTLARDLDIVCVPWKPEVTPHEQVVRILQMSLMIPKVNGPIKRLWGRVAYQLILGLGELTIDLSFTHKGE